MHCVVCCQCLSAGKRTSGELDPPLGSGSLVPLRATERLQMDVLGFSIGAWGHYTALRCAQSSHDPLILLCKTHCGSNNGRVVGRQWDTGSRRRERRGAVRSLSRRLQAGQALHWLLATSMARVRHVSCRQERAQQSSFRLDSTRGDGIRTYWPTRTTVVSSAHAMRAPCCCIAWYGPSPSPIIKRAPVNSFGVCMPLA